MDPTVAKRNAAAEERLSRVARRALTADERASIDRNLERTAGRFELIEKVARRHGVDPAELYTKYVVETRGSVDPENPKVSPAGAKGPFQLMPDERKLWIDPQIADPFEREAEGAARYLADLQKRNRFGNPSIRSLAYNWGEGNVRKWGGDATMSLKKEPSQYIVLAEDVMPRVQEKIRMRDMDRAHRKESAAAQAAVSAPEPLKELGPLEYAKARITRNYRSPEQYQGEMAAYDAAVRDVKTAVKAKYPELP